MSDNSYGLKTTEQITVAFLRMLSRKRDSRFALRILHKDRKSRVAPKEFLIDCNDGQQVINTLQSLRKLEAEGCYNFYFVVNETNGFYRKIKTENIKGIRAVFADFDKPLAHNILVSDDLCSGKFKDYNRETEELLNGVAGTIAGKQRLMVAVMPKPSMMTETSFGNAHAYWLVEGMTQGQFLLMQHIIAFVCKSDTVITDLPRIMRLPGFTNTKAKEPFLSKIIDFDLCTKSREDSTSGTPKHQQLTIFTFEGLIEWICSDNLVRRAVNGFVAGLAADKKTGIDLQKEFPGEYHTACEIGELPNVPEYLKGLEGGGCESLICGSIAKTDFKCVEDIYTPQNVCDRDNYLHKIVGWVAQRDDYTIKQASELCIAVGMKIFKGHVKEIKDPWTLEGDVLPCVETYIGKYWVSARIEKAFESQGITSTPSQKMVLEESFNTLKKTNPSVNDHELMRNVINGADKLLNASQEFTSDVVQQPDSKTLVEPIKQLSEVSIKLKVLERMAYTTDEDYSEALLNQVKNEIVTNDKCNRKNIVEQEVEGLKIFRKTCADKKEAFGGKLDNFKVALKECRTELSQRIKSRLNLEEKVSNGGVIYASKSEFISRILVHSSGTGNVYYDTWSENAKTRKSNGCISIDGFKRILKNAKGFDNSDIDEIKSDLKHFVDFIYEPLDKEVVFRNLYAPNDSTGQVRDVEMLLNTYRQSDIKPAETLNYAIIKPYLDHLAHTLSERAMELFINVQAFIACKPGEKALWMLHIVGAPGVGKSISWVPLCKIVGDDNSVETTTKLALGDFNDPIHETMLVIFDDLQIKTPEDYENFKPFITSPRLTLNLKGDKAVKAKMYQNYGSTGNLDNKIYLGAEKERRIGVIHMDNADLDKYRCDTTECAQDGDTACGDDRCLTARKETQAYGHYLAGFCTDDEFASHWFRYLIDRQAVNDAKGLSIVGNAPGGQAKTALKSQVSVEFVEFVRATLEEVYSDSSNIIVLKDSWVGYIKIIPLIMLKKFLYEEWDSANTYKKLDAPMRKKMVSAIKHTTIVMEKSYKNFTLKKTNGEKVDMVVIGGSYKHEELMIKVIEGDKKALRDFSLMIKSARTARDNDERL